MTCISVYNSTSTDSYYVKFVICNLRVSHYYVYNRSYMKSISYIILGIFMLYLYRIFHIVYWFICYLLRIQIL
jgi:hypothetical protein